MPRGAAENPRPFPETGGGYGQRSGGYRAPEKGSGGTRARRTERQNEMHMPPSLHNLVMSSLLSVGSFFLGGHKCPFPQCIGQLPRGGVPVPDQNLDYLE